MHGLWGTDGVWLVSLLMLGFEWRGRKFLRGIFFVSTGVFSDRKVPFLQKEHFRCVFDVRIPKKYELSSLATPVLTSFGCGTQKNKAFASRWFGGTVYSLLVSHSPLSEFVLWYTKSVVSIVSLVVFLATGIDCNGRNVLVFVASRFPGDLPSEQLERLLMYIVKLCDALVNKVQFVAPCDFHCAATSLMTVRQLPLLVAHDNVDGSAGKCDRSLRTKSSS